MPKINRDDLNRLQITIPPLPEQQKIAEILSTWDRAIELTEKLIRAKEKLKKGLMQQLLTGKRRFPEYDCEEWREYSLNELLKKVERPVVWNDDELYEFEGLFHRDSLYGRQIKTKINIRMRSPTPLPPDGSPEKLRR